MARTIDAEALQKSIQAGTATNEELAQGLALLKAVEAAEAGTPTDEQVALLKAAGLVEEEAPAAAPSAAPPPAAIQKAVEGLQDGPTDLPETGSLLEEIARQGGQPVADVQKSINAAPVLQAIVTGDDRVCKCLEDLTVVVLAQNNLLAQLTPVAGLSAQVEEIQKSLAGMQDTIQKSLAGGNPGGQLATALGDALARIGSVENVLNQTPFSGNPARGGALQKSLTNGAGGDIGMHDAMAIIQKSVLPDFEKAEALGTLQHAVAMKRPFVDVLASYGLSPVAGQQN